MNKDSFVFHKDWYVALKNLGDAARLEVYDAIMREVFGDGNVELSVEANIAMLFISPLIKKDIEKYNLICERRKLAGSQGGMAKASKSKQMVANGSKSKQKVASVASVADNDNDSDIQGTSVPMSKEETKETKKPKSSYPKEYENDFILYGRKGSKKKGYERWKELTEEEKSKMRLHIPYYLQSRDLQYLKDFEGYINQRLFESPVYKGNVLLYDPMKTDSQSADISGGYDMREEYGYFLQGIDQHYGILDNLVMPTYEEYLEIVNMVTLGKLEFSLSQIGHCRYADGTSLYDLFKERFGNG